MVLTLLFRSDEIMTRLVVRNFKPLSPFTS